MYNKQLLKLIIITKITDFLKVRQNVSIKKWETKS